MKRWKNTKENSILRLRLCANFSKLSIKRSTVYRLQSRNTKLEMYIQSHKTTSLLFTMNIALNIQKDKFVHRSDFRTRNLAYFLSKSSKYTVIKIYLQNLSTLIIAKSSTSTTTEITSETSVNNWEHFWCVAHSTLIVGMKIAKLSLLKTWIVRIHCVHKKFFNLSAEAFIYAFNARSRVKSAIFFLKNEHFLFYWSVDKGFVNFQRQKIQIKN